MPCICKHTAYTAYFFLYSVPQDYHVQNFEVRYRDMSSGSLLKSPTISNQRPENFVSSELEPHTESMQ